MIRSIEGASAKDWNITTFERTPDSSKVFTKNRATSYLIPIPAKTITNCSSAPRSFAWRIIWAASLLCGSPFPEKIGSFCPRTREFIPSIAEIPVWIKSLGYEREYGFIGFPFTFTNSEEIISGKPSIGSPRPLNTRPSNSSPTRSSSGLSRNSKELSSKSIPVVEPKI